MSKYLTLGERKKLGLHTKKFGSLQILKTDNLVKQLDLANFPKKKFGQTSGVKKP